MNPCRMIAMQKRTGRLHASRPVEIQREVAQQSSADQGQICTVRTR
jgi:hypothetical protein